MDRKRKVALVLSIMEAVDDEEPKKNRGKTRKWVKRREKKRYVQQFCE